MTRDQLKRVQKALQQAGFDPGPIDGILGRMTINAVAAFQKAKKLKIQYPGTIGPKTLKALGITAVVDAETVLDVPPWVAEIKRKMGLHEVRNNAELKKYLKSDGRTLGDPAKLPWCGDLQETVIAVTLPKEPMITNPYWALNWAKFGVAVPVGMVPLGAIAPFKRPGGGHIGTIVGHDKTYYHVAGGNQSNMISVVKIAKSRQEGGLRWPSTYPLPTKSMPYTVFDGTISVNEA